MERLGKHISFPGVRRRFQQFSFACTLTFCQANFSNLLHLNYVGGEAFAGVITCAKDGVSSYKAWNTPIFRRQMARLNLPALAKLTRSRCCSQDLICHFYFEYWIRPTFIADKTYRKDIHGQLDSFSLRCSLPFILWSCQRDSDSSLHYSGRLS